MKLLPVKLLKLLILSLSIQLAAWTLYDDVGYKKIWISMSLCVSSTASHKSDYNYQAAVILSTWIWRKIFNRQVIVQLIYENDDDKDSVDDLQETLMFLDAEVRVLRKIDEVSCVLMGQTARILAYNYPGVSGDEIIMTADTDLFPTHHDFLAPLHFNYSVWVFWWEAVIHLNQSFPLGLLAMKVGLWKRLMDNSQTVKDLVSLPGSNKRVFTNKNETTDTWEIDQSITTSALLRLLKKILFYNMVDIQEQLLSSASRPCAVVIPGSGGQVTTWVR